MKRKVAKRILLLSMVVAVALTPLPGIMAYAQESGDGGTLDAETPESEGT